MQNDSETITTYITALKQLASSAGFQSGCKGGNCTKSVIELMLRAQFIRGLHDIEIREKLLQLGEVTLDKALETALSIEASTIDNKIIHSVISDRNNVNRIRLTDKNTGFRYGNNKKNSFVYDNDSAKNKGNNRLLKLGLTGMCLHCGRNNHETFKCRLVDDLNCRYCNKDGHIEKVCIAKRISESQSVNRNVKRINDIDSGSEFDVKRVINVLNNDCGDDRMIVNITLNGKQQQFECDSGSRVSIISNDDFKRLNLNVPINKTNVLFRSYTGQVFKPLGVCTLHVSYNGMSCREDLHIVNLKKNAILGRNWIRKLKIDLHEINQVSMTNSAIGNTNTNMKHFKHRFSKVFQQNVGRVPNFTCSLKLKDNSKPVYLKPRPVPYALREVVEKELDKLEKEDIIEKVDQSEWGTPIVIIPKSNGTVRICADYKVTVNQQLHDGRYPIPRIDDILNKMRNGNYFCTLDIYKAYLHLPVDPESAKVQAITTHKGTYLVKRLFFGIKTAPNEFHKFIDQFVQNLKGTVAYFDDIVIQGSTLEECKSRLVSVLEKLEQYNLHVNIDKCKFFERKVQYLGHVISGGGIQKSPEKIKAIQDAPRPTNVEGVRQFLGLVQYYSKFIKNASTLLYPLNQLLRKDVNFKWTSECERTFIQTKKELTSDLVLTPYNPELPIILATDASPVGLSAVLSHKMPNNEERPIMFASRALTAAERNYSQLDKEATAVYWGCKKVFDYIYGRKFTLVIDNKPLMSIFHPDKKLPLLTSTRMLRYAQFISGFDYEVVHKTSSKHGNADYFSRHPLPLNKDEINLVDEEFLVYQDTIQYITTDTITAADIAKETALDEELSQLKEKVLNGHVSDPEISLQEGIIMRGQRVIIPKKLQPVILRELHSTHVGIVRMKALARNYCYWKNIDTDIEGIVRGCKECCEHKKNPEKAPIHMWDVPTHNWQRVHIWTTQDPS